MDEMYGVIEDIWRMVVELRSLVPTVIIALPKKKLLEPERSPSVGLLQLLPRRSSSHLLCAATCSIYGTICVFVQVACAVAKVLFLVQPSGSAENLGLHVGPFS